MAFQESITETFEESQKLYEVIPQTYEFYPILLIYAL